MKKKLNCWEYSKCGREPGGARAEELGVCPAATEELADGLHGGKNGGRLCWAIAGIYALKEKDTLLAKTHFNCFDCEFHRKVIEEEGIVKPGTLKRHEEK